MKLKELNICAHTQNVRREGTETERDRESDTH